jgi:hypothetical protein
MKTEKVILGKAMSPKIKPIPHQCSKAKTIVQTFDSIVFFKDTRLEAQNYVREVLPTLWLIDNCEEKSMNLYNSLGNRWLEFNTTTNLLYLCSINS